VSEENRKFNSNWEKRYSFVNNNGKLQCLVRLQVVSVPKEFLFIQSGITARAVEPESRSPKDFQPEESESQKILMTPTPGRPFAHQL